MLGEPITWIGDAPSAEDLAGGRRRRGRGGTRRAPPPRFGDREGRGGRGSAATARTPRPNGERTRTRTASGIRPSSRASARTRPAEPPSRARRASAVRRGRAAVHRGRGHSRSTGEQPARPSMPLRRRPPAARKSRAARTPATQPRAQARAPRRDRGPAPVGLGDHVPAFLRKTTAHHGRARADSTLLRWVALSRRPSLGYLRGHGSLTTHRPQQILADLWAAAGGDRRRSRASRSTGDEPALPSSFRVGAAAQASDRGVGAGGSRDPRGSAADAAQTVAVDMRHAAVEFRSERYMRIAGKPPAPPWDKIAGVYRTGDGRWVRLHTNFPHHRDGMLKLLGCDYEREAVQAALLEVAGRDSSRRPPPRRGSSPP